MERLLTLEEVSEATRTPVNTLRAWRKYGIKGPRSAKIGKRVFYRESDVAAWINQQFTQSAT